MFEALRGWIETANASPLLENFNNEKLIVFLTSPIGLGIAIGLVLIFILLKWKLSAVILTAIMAGVYVVRYTLNDTDGPNDTIYLFIGAAVALAGFIIYFTLMREE